MTLTHRIKKFLYQHKLSYLLSSSEFNTFEWDTRFDHIYATKKIEAESTSYYDPLIKKEAFLLKRPIKETIEH